MPIPSSITDLSTNPALNSPQGTDSIGSTHDDYMRAYQAILKQVYDEINTKIDNIPKAALEPVRAVDTVGVTRNGLQTVDDISLANNDRVLVAVGSAVDNGIYVVNDSGAWTRADDMAASSTQKDGISVRAGEGTNYAESLWVLKTDGTATIGTTAIEFTKEINISATNAVTGSALDTKINAKATVYDAADEAAMLALSAKKGDFAQRIDQSNKLYRLTAEPATSLSNWQVVSETSPTDILFEIQPIQPMGAITDQTIAKGYGFLLLNGDIVDLTTGYTQSQLEYLHNHVTGDFADIQTAYTQDTSITVIDATEYFGRVTDRNLGSLEEDAIRNITGIIGQYGVKVNTGHPPTGPFSTLSHSLSWIGGSGTGHHGIDFDASRVVPTAAENRPKNLAIAKRWGIFIGE